MKKLNVFLIEDGDLLEKHNTICNKVNADIKKEFGRVPVYNKTFFKTKIKPHGDKATDLFDKENPKMDTYHTCLAVIDFLDSTLRKDDYYYLKVFFKECKYIKKR